MINSFPLGFKDEKKIQGVLLTLSHQVDFNKLFPKVFPELLRLFSLSFDPDQAAINFERFSQKIYDKNYFYTLLSLNPWLSECLVAIFSGSKFITDILLSDPSLFDWISHYEILHQFRYQDDFSRDLSLLLKESASFPERMEALRKFKKREFLRIGIRDLLHKADLVEIMRDLSNVADVCLQAAYQFCLEELVRKYGVPYYQEPDEPERKSEYCVLAMGKLGGQELNFSSDIDLLVLYTSDKGGTKGENGKIRISNHEFFCKLTQMICKSIGEMTSEGNVFRVDLDLRPEGKSGDVANSLRSFEIYYESWGETWERQALLKARLVAGSEDLWQKFFQMTRSFVFRKYLDFSSIEEMRKMKEKINQGLKVSKNRAVDVKLGYGGIREIEFTVQIFQLIYGARDDKIRKRNTLEALQNLYEGKYIGLEDYLALSKAYRFLRELEHRIQIVLGLKTHCLPAGIQEQAILARKMGLSVQDSAHPAGMLMEEYNKNTTAVRKIYDALFTTGNTRKEIIPEEKDICDLTEIDQFISLDSLKAYNFRDPARVYKNLQLLHEGSPFSHPTLKSKRLFAALTLPILNSCARLPDPDLAVNNLERYVTSSGSREVFYSLLLEKEKFREILLVLFGYSEYFSELLIRNPSLIDVLSEEGFVYRFKSRQNLQEELNGIMDYNRDFDWQLEELRKFKKGEELRICLRHLLKETGLISTFSDLSELAVVFLKTALEIAREKLREDFGRPMCGDKDCGFAIIGMGKLGGGELDYGSDLDLVYIYEEEGMTDGREPIPNQFYFAKLSTLIFQVLSKVTAAGYVYKIDLGLRPEGEKGILTVSLDRYKKYFSERALTWEKQALLKAKFVAGDENFGSRFIDFAHQVVYGQGADSAMVRQIEEMRTRMENERAQEGERDIKTGYGGLIDIEFIVQVFQLKYGKAYKEIRKTQTIAALSEIVKIGLISPEEGDYLKETYLFYRSIENALRMQNINASNQLPESGEKMNLLARKIGYPEDQAGEKLLQDYDRRAQKIREIYQKVINRLG